MTNGEKFKEVFKTSEVDEGLLYAFVWLHKHDEVAEINIDWWNSEYQEPKSEWQKDHELLKAYSDGADDVLDKIRAEINTMPCAITSMKEVYVNRDKVINILDKYKGESEG